MPFFAQLIREIGQRTFEVHVDPETLTPPRIQLTRVLHLLKTSPSTSLVKTVVSALDQSEFPDCNDAAMSDRASASVMDEHMIFLIISVTEKSVFSEVVLVMRLKEIGDVSWKSRAALGWILLQPGPSYFNRICAEARAKFGINNRRTILTCLRTFVTKGIAQATSEGKGKKTFYVPVKPRIIDVMIGYRLWRDAIVRRLPRLHDSATGKPISIQARTKTQILPAAWYGAYSFRRTETNTSGTDLVDIALDRGERLAILELEGDGYRRIAELFRNRLLERGVDPNLLCLP